MTDVQKVRLADMFFIAPVLMYASTQRQLSQPVRTTLLGIGIATLLYNAHNYIKSK